MLQWKFIVSLITVPETLIKMELLICWSLPATFYRWWLDTTQGPSLQEDTSEKAGYTAQAVRCHHPPLGGEAQPTTQESTSVQAFCSTKGKTDNITDTKYQLTWKLEFL